MIVGSVVVVVVVVVSTLLFSAHVTVIHSMPHEMPFFFKWSASNDLFKLVTSLGGGGRIFTGL